MMMIMMMIYIYIYIYNIIQFISVVGIDAPFTLLLNNLAGQLKREQTAKVGADTDGRSQLRMLMIYETHDI